MICPKDDGLIVRLVKDYGLVVRLVKDILELLLFW